MPVPPRAGLEAEGLPDDVAPRTARGEAEGVLVPAATPPPCPPELAVGFSGVREGVGVWEEESEALCV